MVKRTSMTVLFLVLCSAYSPARGNNDKPQPQWADVTSRGRLLAEYDVAAWHASDAVEGLKPDKSVASIYVARHVDNGWEVVFGRLNEKRDKFLLAYRASQSSGPQDFTIKKLDPPDEDQGFYLAAAKALETALTDFGKASRPYNKYVLPAPKNQLYVYLLPAQTTDHVYPMGGDVRYLLSEDGSAISEKHQMHKTNLEFDMREGSTKIKKIESGIHTHVLSNVPEDTDVFYVLSRSPLIPEYIRMMDKKIYVIQVDGTIYLGR